MAREGALRELGRFSEEYRRATAGRGTPYPCTQEQIDIYTVEPLCCRGNNYAMSEEDATRMLVDFLDPRRAPTHKVFSALQRIANAMFTVDDWYLDVVIKAASDIDTAFFMGYLRGNVSINWISRLRLAELGHGARHMLGSTYPGSHGCSSVWLNTQAIFDETEFPRRKMWQVLFHELIVSHSMVYVLNGDNMLTYDVSMPFASRYATPDNPPPTIVPTDGMMAMDTCFVNVFGQSKSEQRHTSMVYVYLLIKIFRTSISLAGHESIDG